MKYFMLTATEDGELVCGVYDSLEDIAKEYTDDDMDLPTPLTKFEDVDPNYMDGKCMIIRGEIVVPKPRTKVTTWGEA